MGLKYKFLLLLFMVWKLVTEIMNDNLLSDLKQKKSATYLRTFREAHQVSQVLYSFLLLRTT